MILKEQYDKLTEAEKSEYTAQLEALVIAGNAECWAAGRIIGALTETLTFTRELLEARARRNECQENMGHFAREIDKRHPLCFSKVDETATKDGGNNA